MSTAKIKKVAFIGLVAIGFLTALNRFAPAKVKNFVHNINVG